MQIATAVETRGPGIAATLWTRTRAWWVRVTGPAAPRCPRCGTAVHCDPFGAVAADGRQWITTWACPLCALPGYVWEPIPGAAAVQSPLRPAAFWRTPTPVASPDDRRTAA